MKNLKFIILLFVLMPLFAFGQSSKKKTKISCYSCTEIEYEDCDICRKGTTTHFNGIVVERGKRKPRMIPTGFIPIVDERNKKVMIFDWLNSTRLDRRITTIELADTEYTNMTALMAALDACNCSSGGGTDNQQMTALVNGNGTFTAFLTGLTPSNFTIDVNTIVETTADVVTTAAINGTTGDLEFFDGAGDILATVVLPSGTNILSDMTDIPAYPSGGSDTYVLQYDEGTSSFSWVIDSPGGAVEGIDATINADPLLTADREILTGTNNFGVNSTSFLAGGSDAVGLTMDNSNLFNSGNGGVMIGFGDNTADMASAVFGEFPSGKYANIGWNNGPLSSNKLIATPTEIGLYSSNSTEDGSFIANQDGSLRMESSISTYVLGDGSGVNTPVLDSDVDSRLMLLALNGTMYQSNAAAWKTLTGTGVPGNGTTTAYYEGQLYKDVTTDLLYSATSKSTDPDVAATGSTWTAIASSGGGGGGIVSDDDGDTFWEYESGVGVDEDHLRGHVGGIARYTLDKNGKFTISSTTEEIIDLYQNFRTNTTIRLNNSPNTRVWSLGHDLAQNDGFFIDDITGGIRPFEISGDNGELFLSQYGSGSITGTATQGLAVDASGKVIEVTLSGGGSSSYTDVFSSGDWTLGSPNTYTILQTTHGLSASDIYHVTVVDTTLGEIVITQTSIDAAGNITLSTTGAVFDGKVLISE